MEEMKNLKSGAFKNTFCVFTELPIEEFSVQKWSFQSKSGSSYFYSKLGMYRYSSHWGKLANSKWRLIPMHLETPSKNKLGFAPWENFYTDNNFEKLYYIEVCFKTKTVNYQHRNNPKYNSNSVLRTSLETKKRIKQIRNLFELTSWANYFETDDIDKLRKYIITDLITSDKSLDEIKRKYYE
jgi:hypothetical protein